VRAFAERRSPSLAVLSFREIEASTTIKPIQTIGMHPPAAA
jgi:type III secretory pathway component EscV